MGEWKELGVGGGGAQMKYFKYSTVAARSVTV